MLDTPHFNNRLTRELPADLQSANFRHQVHGVCYSRVAPTPVASPRLITYAPEVAELLDTTPATCASLEFVQVFSGNKLLHGMDPFAMCYGGYVNEFCDSCCEMREKREKPNFHSTMGLMLVLRAILYGCRLADASFAYNLYYVKCNRSCTACP